MSRLEGFHGLEDRVRRYFRRVHKVWRRADSGEESLYGPLRELLEGHPRGRGLGEIEVTVQPRLTAGGQPDFCVWRDNHRIVGFVEAKAPGTDLAKVEKSEQLLRYRETFPNLVLTDFCSFRLYRHGDDPESWRDGPVLTVRAGWASTMEELDEPPAADEVGELGELLDRFLGFSSPKLRDAPTLARELARRTRFLRHAVLSELRAEARPGPRHLHAFYEAFRTLLIAHLSEEQFADLYAQTIAYGLFAARTRAGEDFHRREAVNHIPRTIGILHDVFEFLSWGELPGALSWVIDDLAQVLAHAEVRQILDRYYRDGKGHDPILHFYETFLAEYDPTERERRGVYYTPEPVVGYIVGGVHEILRTHLGCEEGLASGEVSLLDPAAGTMTFVAKAVETAVAARSALYGKASRSSFIRDHVLPHFHGFELMVAPYAVGHLKMGYYLEELGHPLESGERFQLYLTNTLEMEATEQSELPVLGSLSEEAEQARRVKRGIPMLVILGNPPYSGHSANRGEWIRGLIEDYKALAPELRRPGQAKWLQDDYVKFIRFAEWKIARAGQGVVAMVTNHAWLDNPTFRGMRRHLLSTFDEIRVLDLHGSTLKKERAPDGGSDQNVFDVRPGVAVTFFIKRPGETASAEGGGDPEPAIVYHAELWGSRSEKYEWLDGHRFGSTPWRRIEPRERFYRFVPVDRSSQAVYKRFAPLPALFCRNGRPAPGIVTTQDQFAVSRSREEVVRKVEWFLTTPNEEEARLSYRFCSQDQWRYERAKEELAEGTWRNEIEEILYRPFDVRWTVFNRNVAVHRRMRVMRHMLAGPNLGLVSTRSIDINRGFEHAFCTRLPIQHHAVSTKEVNYLFPLYLYREPPPDGLFSAVDSTPRSSNLHPKLLPFLGTAYRRPVSPEELFGYIYAILYAPTYRESHADSLRIDFPHIPFPADGDLFFEVATLGGRLVSLHLLESDDLQASVTRFHGEGEEQVAPLRSGGFGYDEEREAVMINRSQRFAPVPPEVWHYTIGGSRVLRKWVKDRRNSALTSNEIRTYCRIVTALVHTLAVEREIDELYPLVESELLDLPFC